MSDTSKAILLVADISGFTKFMKQHALATSHAKQIVVRLLKSVIYASKPPLKVAELEGDAVFFYAIAPQKDVQKVTEEVKAQVVKFFAAFKRELDQINNLKTCACDACERVTDLRLKQVIHIGDIAIEKIEHFEKLFGIDVILVHRMLKNSVPSNEYVMMTDPVYTSMKDFYGLEPERRKESFEGVGDVETLVFYPGGMIQKLGKADAEAAPASLTEKMAWRWQISWRTLFEFVGLKKTKGAFNNIPA
jgi:hypothetical protein